MKSLEAYTENRIIMNQPRRLVFGNDCVSQFIEDFAATALDRAFVVTAPPIRSLIDPLLDSLKAKLSIWDCITREPDTGMFEDARKACRSFGANAVIGIGGGSVLDVAKLVAAMSDTDGDIHDAFGIGKLSGRNIFLACLPTTSGTGSEVSPNALIIDQLDNTKKGVISPYIVPDASYIDPMLTLTVPPDMTASTGMDALTHCIEAYANKFANPITDLYAFEGIKLIADNLKIAFDDGKNIVARTKMALGSLYGGLCLGPVNTGAVHALAYPLGSEYKVPHGLSNSMMLPHVIDFNIPASPERYAQVAIAMGVSPASSDTETAKLGLKRIKQLSSECGIPSSLSKIGIPYDAINRMAKSAMTVTRLLKNNLRELSVSDAEEIYIKAY